MDLVVNRVEHDERWLFAACGLRFEEQEWMLLDYHVEIDAMDDGNLGFPLRGNRTG